MTDQSYLPSLTQAGLTPQQAAVYETLVKMGATPARKLALESKLSRPLAYKVLDELIEQGLVEKQDKPGAVAKFLAAHPLKLKEIADKRFEAAQTAKIALDGAMGKLISDFNLQSGKPGVRFFEGREGVKEVLWDTLTSKERLRSYADIEAIAKYARDINTEYVNARKKYDVKKDMIVLDTPGSRQFLGARYPEIIDIRLIKMEEAPFQSVMHIYDNKISYITLGESQMIGVIISDPRIYVTHRYLFDFAWRQATPYAASESSSNAA